MGSAQEEDEEVEDLSSEVASSYKDVLASAKEKKPSSSSSKPPLPKKLKAAPIMQPIAIAAPAPPPVPSAWRTALQQAVHAEQRRNGDDSRHLAHILAELDTPTLSSLLARLPPPPPPPPASSSSSASKDYALLLQLERAYEEEIRQWELVRRQDLVHRPPQLVQREVDFANEAEDAQLIRALHSAQASLPGVQRSILLATEQRCDAILSRIHQCEQESKQLARAFSRAAFEEDSRQPKKLVKLLSGDECQFEF